MLTIRYDTPLLLVLAIKKLNMRLPIFEKCIPKSSVNKGKKVGSSSQLIGNPMIATTFKSVRLIRVKRKTKLFMDVAQKPRKLNIKAVFTRISC